MTPTQAAFRAAFLAGQPYEDISRTLGVRVHTLRVWRLRLGLPQREWHPVERLTAHQLGKARFAPAESAERIDVRESSTVGEPCGKCGKRRWMPQTNRCRGCGELKPSAVGG